jgi:hypothetical protein
MKMSELELVKKIVQEVLSDIEEVGPLAGKFDWMDKETFESYESGIVDRVYQRIKNDLLSNEKFNN